MAKKYLIVVDMQKDFIDGALGSAQAQAIVPAVTERVNGFVGEILFTMDTHQENYPDTQEGKLLPVTHCIENTDGWRLIGPLEEIREKKGLPVFKKGTFGCIALAKELLAAQEKEGIESVELIGVCTDICVVSNALLIKAYLPEVPVIVRADCCAGVTPKKHEAALETMRSCQIIVE